MVADDDAGAGFEHLVGDVDVFRAGRGSIFDAPVNGDDEEVALGARLFDGGEHGGIVSAGRSSGFAGIGKKVGVGLIVFIGIAIAVEPAGHAEPSDLDAVGFSDHGLKGLRGGVAGAGEEQAFLTQVLARFGEAGPTLVHDVVIGEGDDFDAAGFESVKQGDGGVKHEGLAAFGVGRGHRGFEVHETEVGMLEDVGDIGEQGAPSVGVG